MTSRVAVAATEPRVQERAQRLAASLGLALTDLARPVNVDFMLVVLDDRLELRRAAEAHVRGICADFSSIDLRSGAGNLSRRQPLPRAIGRNTTRVLDATAGLGDDAALLACMGYDVTALERANVVFELLADGIRRARDHPDLAHLIDAKLRARNTDAGAFLQTTDQRFDACYIDPMFPPRRRQSALPRKAMQVLRELVGDDDDAAQLLDVARRRIARVAVKRPHHAPPLAPDTAHSITSKLVRYDVYLNPQAGDAP